MLRSSTIATAYSCRADRQLTWDLFVPTPLGVRGGVWELGGELFSIWLLEARVLKQVAGAFLGQLNECCSQLYAKQQHSCSHIDLRFVEHFLFF